MPQFSRPDFNMVSRHTCVATCRMWAHDCAGCSLYDRYVDPVTEPKFARTHTGTALYRRNACQLDCVADRSTKADKFTLPRAGCGQRQRALPYLCTRAGIAARMACRG